jgi:hypothetical protein
MGLRKGQSNNRHGRPAGKKNKISRDLRKAINDFLEGNFRQLKNDFKKLTPAMRVKIYLDLLQFGLPKLANTTVQNEYDRMSDLDIARLANELIEKLKSDG